MDHVERMEKLLADCEDLRKQMEGKKAEEANVMKEMIEGKMAEYDRLDEEYKGIEQAEAAKKRLDEIKAKRNEIEGKAKELKTPNAEVPDSEHNIAMEGKKHERAFLGYVTHEESGAKAKAITANEHGEEFMNRIGTKFGMKLPDWMCDYIVPQQTSMAELEKFAGKDMRREMGGKTVLLVREASGTNTGGGSAVNIDFEPSIFRVPQRLNDIPSKCWVKRAIGKEAQFPTLTQSTNAFGVAATWGNSGVANGEGSSLSQSDPTLTRVDVNLERLALITAVSKRFLRNEDVGFLGELAWMYRGTWQFQVGKGILGGVMGVTALRGINSNWSIGQGYTDVTTRQTANQISYTDAVNLQFEVSDGIFGTGEYILSAGSGGGAKYVMALDDSQGRPIFSEEDTWRGSGVRANGTIANRPYTVARELARSNTNTPVPVGDRGDLLYGDFRTFGLVVDAENLAIERSDDYGFNTGEIYFRLITYVGGQPLGADCFAVLGDTAGVSSSSSSSS
jgi:HK97 family phage major capsid protein